MAKPDVIVVTGPTASGKSALALALAERRGGAVINADAIRVRLAERDPVIVAKLKPGDRQRHVRAWEVLLASGRPLSVWQSAERKPAPWTFATLLLAPDRAWLRERIETRFDDMLK